MIAYIDAVGTKFHADGRLRYFPGNTIVCHTAHLEPLQSQLIWVQDQYKKLSFADSKLSFLPPSSFHMTFFELLCDQVREPELWSSKLALDTPLQHPLPSNPAGICRCAVEIVTTLQVCNDSFETR